MTDPSPRFASARFEVHLDIVETMDRTTLLFLALPVVFVVVSILGFFFVARSLAFRSGPVHLPEDSMERPRRPWWGNPLVWLGLAALSLVLGVVVTPAFFPGFVVFLPFVWVGGRGPSGSG